MQAIILAGGFGTRLSEKTEVMPKPMIQVGGAPVLWHIMKYCSCFDIKDFTIALGYKGEVIKDYFLGYHDLHSDLQINLATGNVQAKGTTEEDWQVSLVDTGLNSMTGGRLRRLKDRISETFLFTYGDGLSNVDINSLIKFHRSHGKLATVTAVPAKQRFGVLRIDEKNNVQNFAEKPEQNEQVINGGYFILEPEVIDFITDDSTVWEREPCEQLVKQGQMMAYSHDGYWQCVDTLHELRLLRKLWDVGEAEWKIW